MRRLALAATAALCSLAAVPRPAQAFFFVYGGFPFVPFAYPYPVYRPYPPAYYPPAYYAPPPYPPAYYPPAYYPPPYYPPPYSYRPPPPSAEVVPRRPAARHTLPASVRRPAAPPAPLPPAPATPLQPQHDFYPSGQ